MAAHSDRYLRRVIGVSLNFLYIFRIIKDLWAFIIAFDVYYYIVVFNVLKKNLGYSFQVFFYLNLFAIHLAVLTLIIMIIIIN